MRDQRLLAGGLVLAGVASVQIGSAIAVELFSDVGPGGAVFLRTVFAALILLALWRPARDHLKGRTARDIVVFGLVLAGMNFCFFQALDRLPLGIAVTLEFTGPLGVAIATSRRRLDLLWTGLAAGGILLLSPGIAGDRLPADGVAFALAAGFFWGMYVLASARVGRGAAGRGGLSAAMVVATIVLIPVGLAGGGADLIGAEVLLLGLGVALLSSAIPYTTELEALRRLPPGTFGVLLSAEPAFAALVGYLALGQDLPLREVAAILLVMAASAGALSTAPRHDTAQA